MGYNVGFTIIQVVSGKFKLYRGVGDDGGATLGEFATLEEAEAGMRRFIDKEKLTRRYDRLGRFLEEER